MKKKRTLRKPINYLLLFITMVLFIFIVSVDKMSLDFIPVYLGLTAILAFNIYILVKYGDKKIIYEEN